MSQSVPYQSLFKDHDVIGYTYNPNLKIRVSHEAGGFLLKTNEFGFRSNGIPKDPEKDRFSRLFHGRRWRFQSISLD